MYRSTPWDKAFDAVSAYITSKQPAGKNALILSSDRGKSDDLRVEADRENCDLFLTAIQTLKQDMVSGKCGDLGLACINISLRNSFLSKSLHVEPPRFRTQPPKQEKQAADEQMAFEYMALLFGAAADDLIQSKNILITALNDAQHRDRGTGNAHGEQSEMMKAFIKEAGGMWFGEKHPQEELIYHHMAVGLKTSVQSYKSLLNEICAHIKEISPYANWAPTKPRAHNLFESIVNSYAPAPKR